MGGAIRLAAPLAARLIVGTHSRATEAIIEPYQNQLIHKTRLATARAPPLPSDFRTPPHLPPPNK